VKGAYFTPHVFWLTNGRARLRPSRAARRRSQSREAASPCRTRTQKQWGTDGNDRLERERRWRLERSPTYIAGGGVALGPAEEGGGVDRVALGFSCTT
jgi:hypothetical protein